MNVETFVENLSGKPEHFAYFGELTDFDRWRYLPFGQHRDSDALERSNFEVITEDLLERFPESIVIEGSSHFLVGWVDQVRIDTHDTDAVEAAFEWFEKLQDYPVADEEHFSETEYAETEEYYNNGGREDAIDELENLEDFEHIFDDDGELLPEFEECLNRAFHNAQIDGSLGYMPRHMENALAEQKIVDRMEYERHQPPLDSSGQLQ